VNASFFHANKGMNSWPIVFRVGHVKARTDDIHEVKIDMHNSEFDSSCFVET
jgi:hypothetical protein